MSHSIRVGLVEDNAKLRQQLSQLLSTAPGFTCTGAWPDAESALSALSSSAATPPPATSPAPACLPPDVVLMDIELPRMSGVECVARLKDRLPDLKVVMLTVYDDSENIFQALQNGANGYLLKRTPPAEILKSIEEVQNGGAPMNSHIARLVVQSFHRRGNSPRSAENLTPREDEVLHLVARGLINKEIADQLGITLETVRQHLKNCYSKLHVRTRTEAAMKRFR